LDGAAQKYNLRYFARRAFTPKQLKFNNQQAKVHDNILGGHRVTTGRQVPFCIFTDPEFARIGLNETQANERGVAYRLAKIPLNRVQRAQTLSETRAS
jgi:pyruvate/2-oxoglutarate dehydrogenase complex dihydrolipoamide dehydrogenase (E3) component